MSKNVSIETLVADGEYLGKADLVRGPLRCHPDIAGGDGSDA